MEAVARHPGAARRGFAGNFAPITFGSSALLGVDERSGDQAITRAWAAGGAQCHSVIISSVPSGAIAMATKRGSATTRC